MGHWFWAKQGQSEWRPIYAESEQQAKNKRSEIARNPATKGITPIRPASDQDLPMMLKHTIKRVGGKDA